MKFKPEQYIMGNITKSRARGDRRRHAGKHLPRRHYLPRISNRTEALETLEDTFGVNDNNYSADIALY